MTLIEPKSQDGPRRPRLGSKLDAHAGAFYDAFPIGGDLVWALVKSGWIVSFLQSLSDFQRENPSYRPDGQTGREWVLRARPPVEIAESFDLQVEVLFFVSDFTDLQARTVQLARSTVEADPRVSRDVVFLVTRDEAADDKVSQIPNSDGVIPISWGWIRSASGGGQGEKPLRPRLERHLYARDLFDIQIPVVGNRFFGRQQSLQFLHRQVVSGQPVGVFGLRKICNTSLLKTFVAETRKSWTGGEPVVVAVHLDLQAAPLGHRDWAYLLWEIGRQAVEGWMDHPAKGSIRYKPRHLTSDLLPPAGSDVSAAFDSDIKRLLDSMAKAGPPHLVVVLDEIERLVPPTPSESGFNGAVDFLRYLRGLNQQGSGLTMILAGANPYLAERSVIAEQENPLLNFIVKHYLAPLSDEEVRPMIARLGGAMGVKFHHEATTLVVHEAGGHPFLTRQLCSLAVRRDRRARPIVIERSGVEAVLPEFAVSQHHTFQQVFESLNSYPEEQFLLRQLAEGEMGFVAEWAASDPMGLEHLKGYGLIEPTVTDYVLSIPSFRNYLLSAAAR